jgi:hypothetical protein
MRCVAISLYEPMIPDVPKKNLEKKEQGAKPCSKNCVDPISPQRLDLILI